MLLFYRCRACLVPLNNSSSFPGVIKGVARIIFCERIEMEVIDYKEEYHRGVRKDHWVFHVRFVEFNLSPMGLDGKISQEVFLRQPLY